MSEYFIGIKVTDKNEIINPATIPENSIIGLVGTCSKKPDDFTDESTYYILTSQSKAREFDGTIGDSLKLIFSQSPAKVIILKADNEAGFPEKIEKFVDCYASLGMEPEFLIAPLESKDSLKTPIPPTKAKDDAQKEVTRINEEKEALKLEIKAVEGKLKKTPDDEALKKTLQDSMDRQLVLDESLKQAEEKLSAIPDSILQYEVVGAKLVEIAKKIDAIPIFDIPDAAAKKAANGEQNAIPASLKHYSSQACWPFVKVAEYNEDGALAVAVKPMSALVAGMHAKTDKDESRGGFWETCSNRQVNGILGSDSLVPYRDDEQSCLANQLGAACITTIIRDDGFRLWNAARGLFSQDDKRWQFIPVVRTWRVIKRMLKTSHKWAIARGVKKNLIQEIEVSATEGLKQLKKRGAIVDGECFRDEEMMTDSELMEGRLHFLAKFTPVYITQQIHFGLAMTNEYLKGVKKNG